MLYSGGRIKLFQGEELRIVTLWLQNTVTKYRYSCCARCWTNWEAVGMGAGHGGGSRRSGRYRPGLPKHRTGHRSGG
jgi:hypothetical protein